MQFIEILYEFICFYLFIFGILDHSTQENLNKKGNKKYNSLLPEKLAV